MRLRLAFLLTFFLLFAASAQAASYPDALAKVVESYPGASVTMSMESGDGVQVILQSADPADKVAQWYLDYFKKAGWKLDMKVEAGDTISLAFVQEGSEGGVNVNATPDNGKTMITIIMVTR